MVRCLCNRRQVCSIPCSCLFDSLLYRYPSEIDNAPFIIIIMCIDTIIVIYIYIHVGRLLCGNKRGSSFFRWYCALSGTTAIRHLHSTFRHVNIMNSCVMVALFVCDEILIQTVLFIYIYIISYIYKMTPNKM